MSSEHTSRRPLFSRLVLLIGAFVSCVLALVVTWWLRGRQWSPTLAPAVVLVTLVSVLPLGEFIRHRFKLSLRSALVLMTVVAILLGFFGAQANRARDQRRAANSVLSLRRPISGSGEPPHSDVSYGRHNDLGDDLVRTRGGWILASWMVDFLGQDFLFDVHDILIQNQDLSAVDALADVELEPFNRICLGACLIGTNTMERIGSVEGLRVLQLSHTGITDDHLEPLAKLNKLETLYVGNIASLPESNKITDAGLAHLSKLTSLRHLSVDNTDVTGDGLIHLQGLKKLELLQVPGTAISNSDVRMIAKNFPALIGLHLSNTAVNEDVIPLLQAMPNLQWVALTPSTKEVRQRLEQQEFSKPMFYFR